MSCIFDLEYETESGGLEVGILAGAGNGRALRISVTDLNCTKGM